MNQGSFHDVLRIVLKSIHIFLVWSELIEFTKLE